MVNVVQASPSVAGIHLSKKTIGGVLLTLLLVGVFVLPVEGAFKGAALVLYCAVCWSLGLLPNWLTAFIIFALACITQVAPTAEVLSGFTSPAVWLVLGGLFLGAAIDHTGLARSIAARLAPYLLGRPIKTLVSVNLLCLLTVFVMPSAMGRAILMAPILMSLAQSLGLSKQSRASIGIVLGGTFMTFFPAYCVLPANVPNNVLMGCMHEQLGITVDYLQYLLYHFPVLGMIKVLGVIGFTLFFYRKPLMQEWEQQGIIRDSVAARLTQAQEKLQRSSEGSCVEEDDVFISIMRQAHAPLTAPQRIMLVMLCCTLVLWCTEHMHGISVAWISMVAAIICLVPGLNLMPPKPFSAVNLAAFFFVAGVLSMGTLANVTGFGERFVSFLVQVLPFSSSTPFASFLLLALVSTIMSILVTAPGSPAILTPLSQQLSVATGLSLPVVSMTQVVGFSTTLLPYQAPNLIIACQMTNMPTSEVLRATSLLAVLSVVVAWPLDYLWWCLLGFIS